VLRFVEVQQIRGARAGRLDGCHQKSGRPVAAHLMRDPHLWRGQGPRARYDERLDAVTPALCGGASRGEQARSRKGRTCPVPGRGRVGRARAQASRTTRYGRGFGGATQVPEVTRRCVSCIARACRQPTPGSRHQAAPAGLLARSGSNILGVMSWGRSRPSRPARWTGDPQCSISPTGNSCPYPPGAKIDCATWRCV